MKQKKKWKMYTQAIERTKRKKPTFIRFGWVSFNVNVKRKLAFFPFVLQINITLTDGAECKANVFYWQTNEILFFFFSFKIGKKTHCIFIECTQYFIFRLRGIWCFESYKQTHEREEKLKSLLAMSNKVLSAQPMYANSVFKECRTQIH